jgi:thiamine pyrophosphate-dependent acetolactate synthase large subunit-like protein
MALNGGSLLAGTLAEVAPVVFTLHGGHLDSFFKGCREAGIELVDFRHEAAAVNAADGYARATGRLGVAAVTSGPGFTNAFAGLANAYADGVPLLLITSAPPLGEAETNELQGGIDQVAAATPVTRWAHRITTAERIPDLVGLAVRRALAGRPGPVLLELPIDVAFTPVDPARLRPTGPPRSEPGQLRPPRLWRRPCGCCGTRTGRWWSPVRAPCGRRYVICWSASPRPPASRCSAAVPPGGPCRPGIRSTARD